MGNIRIIHTNDIHSSFEEFLRMGTIIKENANENTIILDGGDFNDFSSIITKGSNGKAGLDMLNHLGYSALTIGNNEGFQKIKTIEKMCSFNLIDILSCNLFKEDGSQVNGVKPFIIKKTNNIRFLIIGVSPYRQSYDEYFNCYGMKVVEPFDIIRKIIKDQKDNYDFVILLSHLGLKTDIMMTQSINNIDIIIGGHSHHAIDAVKVNNTIIHQSGVRGSHVGILDICINDGKIVGFNDKNIENTGKIAPDKQVTKLFMEYEEIAKEKLRKIVAKANETLVYNITNECNYTNLIVDYLYNKYECDFALVNSGITQHNVKKGKVSKEDIILTCNSPLIISSIHIKGKHIIKAIEESSDKLKCLDSRRMIGFRGKFLGKLHVSYNCKIKQNQLYINGELISEKNYYKIVTVDLLSRGMGYKSLKRHKEYALLKETIQETITNAINDEKAYEHINQRRWED